MGYCAVEVGLRLCGGVVAVFGCFSPLAERKMDNVGNIINWYWGLHGGYVIVM